MAHKIITAAGDPFESLVWRNGGRPEETEDDDGNISLRFEVMCETASWATLKPARNSSPPEPWATKYPNVKRRETGIISCFGRPGTIVTIYYLVYRELSALTWPVSTLEETRSASSSTIEKSIDEHPTLTDAQKLEAKRQGRTSYLQATVTYNYTDSDASFGWTQAEIVGNIGNTGAPTGMASATAARWLHNQREINEADDGSVTIKDGWQYDENEWQPGTY